jgi:hypothetical protein
MPSPIPTLYLRAQQQLEGAEVQKLREELQQTRAEIGALSTEKFQKQVPQRETRD